MEIKTIDSEGYFGVGYYCAEISRIESYKTKYGPRLLLWMKITNEHQKEMLINDFIPVDATNRNLTTTILKIAFPGNRPKILSTDDLIGKKIGVVLRKKIKRGRSYLDVEHYLPVRLPDVDIKKLQTATTSEIATQLATILLSNPEVAKLTNAKLKTLSHTKQQPHGKKGPQKLGDVIKDMDH